MPDGPGTPLPDAAAVRAAAFAHCRGLRSLSAELAVSGRVASERVRGRLVAGFAEPDALRLEAVAPFGAPGFILVAAGGRATLLLPRESAVLADADPAEVLQALTGVTLGPADLRGVLAGCAPDAPITSGVGLTDGWAMLHFTDGTAASVRRTSSRWALKVLARAPWRAEYPDWPGQFPSSVHLVAGDADVHLEVRQLAANVSLDPAAFTVIIPEGTRSITLADLDPAGEAR